MVTLIPSIEPPPQRAIWRCFANDEFWLVAPTQFRRNIKTHFNSLLRLRYADRIRGNQVLGLIAIGLVKI